MDAIVMAGGVCKPEDPLYPYTQNGCKALIDIDGKPMIQWVLDALNGSKQIDRVIIVGLEQPCLLVCSHPLILLEGTGSLLGNIRQGASYLLGEDSGLTYCLAVSSDVPAIRPEMIDWLIDSINALEADVFYTVLERSVMEKQYPQSRRTYLKLRDLELCGGDVNAFHLEIGRQGNPVAESLVAARKFPLKMASIIGWGTLLAILFRRLTLDQAVERVCQRLHLNGKALVCPYPQMGMDVDKPFQLEQIMGDLRENVQHA